MNRLIRSILLISAAAVAVSGFQGVPPSRVATPSSTQLYEGLNPFQSATQKEQEAAMYYDPKSLKKKPIPKLQGGSTMPEGWLKASAPRLGPNTKKKTDTGFKLKFGKKDDSDGKAPAKKGFSFFNKK